MEKRIAGKSIEEWKHEYPLLQKVITTQETFWLNPKLAPFNEARHKLPLTKSDVLDAEARLRRFASYLTTAFPETERLNGLIESTLIEIPSMKKEMETLFNTRMQGDLLLKCDNSLPIAGSIKARGGIYEVLKHAEELAMTHNLLSIEDDYSIMASKRFHQFFSNYSIAVGSTGNLGLSIGIMSAKLGFNVTVHMSHDAKQWKKELLRKKGVTVKEYDSDYSKAVEEGRKQCEGEPTSYFIDDENSKHLFLGYAVAAIRLKQQLDEMKFTIDEEHPLFVYLPCGVGGGPGGVAFGLKLLYEDLVHCFFAEPTHSPCMLIGLMTGKHDQLAVQDFSIDNRTAADGLAVGRPSSFVGRIMEELLSGIYTVEDAHLFKLLSTLIDSENISLEPSALAGLYGPLELFHQKEGKNYIEKMGLTQQMSKAVHICWATGGSLVPPEIITNYYEQGKLYLQDNE